ncbi:MAG: hypothetical protein L0216_02890 [Planctomycetales bacterium]|nr:hypothetical protein [Planctomycetales bacterium]
MRGTFTAAGIAVALAAFAGCKTGESKDGAAGSARRSAQIERTISRLEVERTRAFRDEGARGGSVKQLDEQIAKEREELQRALAAEAAAPAEVSKPAAEPAEASVGMGAPEPTPAAPAESGEREGGEKKDDGGAVMEVREEPVAMPPVEPINADFKDASLDEVLGFLGETAGLSVICADGGALHARVSARLKMIPWQTALHSILGAVGANYELDESTRLLVLRPGDPAEAAERASALLEAEKNRIETERLRITAELDLHALREKLERIRASMEPPREPQRRRPPPKKDRSD